MKTSTFTRNYLRFMNSSVRLWDKTAMQGLTAIGPLLPSVVPFGIMAGIGAREAGLDVWASMAMSVVIFAGAAQLAATQMMVDGVLPLVIILTALVINLRMLMYSASLAPHLAGLPRYWKWPLAYLITDQAYAVSIHRMMRDPNMIDRHRFFFWTAFPMWFVWVLATATGVAIGSAVPAAWRLEFAVPLIFLALLVSSVHDRPTLAAAVAGGGVALVAHPLPFNLGLIAGALCGVIAGTVADRRRTTGATG